MLTEEEDVEIHALAKRGWTVSEIARHTGRDRKTVRAYLSGARQRGVRAATEPDPFDRVEGYVRQRLVDDHGLWATTLFDEVQALGYGRSHPTFLARCRKAALEGRWATTMRFFSGPIRAHHPAAYRLICLTRGGEGEDSG